MNLVTHVVAIALLAVAGSAFAGNALSDNHPEAAYPDKVLPLYTPGPSADLVRQVQERLHALDFDAGPVNGEFGSKTQAALVQFQLSSLLPASGSLDEETLAELGVQRGEAAAAAEEAPEASAAAGETAD